MNPKVISLLEEILSILTKDELNKQPKAQPIKDVYPPVNKVEEKKDYEILTCKCDGGEIHKYDSSICLGKFEYVNPYKIHSVKRLSDGEVFSIGDNVYETVTGDNSKMNCNDFSIKDTRCFIHGVNIYNVEKVKQPIKLFTTEDGVSVYDGMELYSVSIQTFELGHVGKRSTTLVTKGHREWYKYFSTESAANEYILLNKPCLSVNGILNITCDYVYTTDNNKIVDRVRFLSTNKIIELAKQKLNKQ